MPFGGLLTLGIIGAGTGLASAAIQSHAANSASEKQTEASDKSLALQNQIYGNTRADLSPFVGIGTGALGNLRQLAGIPNAPPPTPVPQMPLQPGSTRDPNTGAVVYAPGTTMAAGDPGYNPTSGSNVGLPGPNGPIQPRTAANPNGTGSGYVTMKAPDGSINRVPSQHVSFYTQKGAQVING